MKEEIKKYYDDLAKDYDADRFANSYGRYIHQQESKILERYLDASNTVGNLDLACGTGRFLEYADYGIDISPEMVKISAAKYPSKKLSIQGAEKLDFPNASFENALSFHLFMHLDLPTCENILAEAHRVLKAGGRFIFDIPSEKRRRVTGYKSAGWHGGNQISVAALKRLSAEGWELEAYHGIAFFPFIDCRGNCEKALSLWII